MALGAVLTERQKEVARLIERGLIDEEIAKELGIATRTVKAHTYELRLRLGVQRKRHITKAFREYEGR